MIKLKTIKLMNLIYFFILIYGNIIFLCFTKQVQVSEWKVLKLDYTKPDISQLAKEGNKIIDKKYRNFDIKLLEIYAIVNYDEYYKLIYGIQDKKTNDIDICFLIIGKRINLRNETEFYEYSSEKLMKTGYVTIHDPLFIEIQKSLLDYFLDYSIILNYISNIQKIGVYYIISCETFSRNNYTFLAKKMEKDYIFKAKIIGFFQKN